MKGSLGGQLLRGGATIYAAFITGKVLTFLSTLILARLLVPEDFGLVGYALLVLSFFDALKTLDLASALVYRQDDTDQVASEIFLLALISASGFFGLCWLLAPAAAAFFHSSEIVPAIRLLGLTLVLGALGEVHIALLQKHMRFTLRYVPQLSLHVVKGLVSVGLALAGFGFWSLVLGQVAGSAISLIVSWSVCPWRPSLKFRWTSACWSLKYGLSSTLVSLVDVAVLSTGSVVVGHLLGETALGLYDLAVTLPQMLIVYAAGAISQVAFPAFAQFQHDRDRLMRGYLTVQRYSGLVLLPIGLGLCAITPAFVHTVYTPLWWQWKLDLLHVMILVPAVVAGAMLGGMLGVALAQIVTVVPFRLFSFWLVHRTIGAGLLAIGASFRTALMSSLLMLVACLLAGALAAPYLQPWAMLLVQVVLGMGVYAAGVLGLDSGLRAHVLPRPTPLVLARVD